MQLKQQILFNFPKDLRTGYVLEFLKLSVRGEKKGEEKKITLNRKINLSFKFKDI